MQSISELLKGIEVEAAPTEVVYGPQTLHILLSKPGQAPLKLTYEAKEGESVQALMIRAAQDITDGEIAYLRMSRRTTYKYKQEEEKALIEQVVAAI